MRGRTRGQAELIGIVLLTGIVVALTFTVGTVVFANASSGAAADPLVNIHGNATTQHVTITHTGGESLDVSSLTVVLRGENSERYDFGTFTQRQGDDQTRFEPGDIWRQNHNVSGSEMEILLVDKESERIVDSVAVDITTTIAARFSTSLRYPQEGDTITFNASDSTVASSTLEYYTWDFDDGTTVNTTSETVDHSYTNDGSYSVTLTVKAADSRVANRTKTVTVYNDAPEPRFAFSPSTPDVNETVMFNGSNSTDSDGTITKYAWDFGDGTTATGETVNHSYDATGNYSVELTVTDDDGATRVTNQLVSVTDSTAPSVTVEQPNGGETWIGGTTETINWTASDSITGVSTVNITYSTDGGSTYTDIVNGTSNDGTYNWTVPMVDSSNVRVKVTARDGAGNKGSDDSDATFTIDSSPPSIETFTGLSASKDTNNVTIGSLSINDSASGLTSVDIVVRDPGGTAIGTKNSTNLGGIATFSATDLQVSTSGIQPNEQYTVTVIAADNVMKEVSASETTTTSGSVADANGPYTVDEGNSITLNGSGSSPNNPKSYDWTIINSPGGDSISEDPSTPNATYNAPTNVDSDTDVTVELAVEDGGTTYTDTATVTVKNVSQNQGTDPAVDSLTLSEQGNEISANWSVSDPDGDLSSVTVDFISQDSTDSSSATSAVSGGSASGTSTYKGNNQETYDVTVTVEDSNGNTKTLTKTITL